MTIQSNYWQSKLDTYSHPIKLGAKMSKSPTITNRRIAYLINHLTTWNVSAERITRLFATLEQAKVFSFSNMAGKDLSLISLLSNRISAKDSKSAVILLESGFPAMQGHLREAMEANLPEVVLTIISKEFAWFTKSISQEVYQWALQNDHQAVALELIQRNQINPDLGTLNILKACEQGHSAVVYWFLKSCTSLDRNEMLKRALQKGHAVIAEMIIDSGEIQIQLDHMRAATRPKMERVFARLLPSVKRDEIENTFDTVGHNLLIAAAFDNLKGCVERLIGAGVNVTKRKENFPTALFVASRHHDSAIIDLLLAQITDPEEKKRHVNFVYLDKTALDTVQSDGCALSLIRAGAEIESAIPVCVAARSLDPDLFSLTLEKIPAKMRQEYLNKGLRAACGAGRFGNIKRLLREGAKVTQKAGKETALHYAAHSSVDCINLILSENATLEFVNACDALGDSALMCAAGHSSAACVRRLIEAGADVTQKNNVGETAVHAACRNNNLETVELLIASVSDADRIAFINQISHNPKNKVSALFIAAEAHFEAIVQRLLQAGAVDTYAITPILEKSNPETLSILRSTSHPVSLEWLKCYYPKQQHNPAFIALCVHVLKQQRSLAQDYLSFGLRVFDRAGLIDEVKTLLTDELIDSGIDLQFLYAREYSNKKIRIGDAVFPINLKILRRRCDFFALLPPSAEDEKEDLVFTDIDPHYFNLMIEDIYSGNRCKIDHDNFKGLVRMADRFDHQPLLARLEQWLTTHPECENWNIDTLCSKMGQLNLA